MGSRSILAAACMFVTAVLTSGTGAVGPQERGHPGSQPTSNPLVKRLTTRSLSFTENKGQWDQRVLFQARTPGTTIWFARDGVLYSTTRDLDGNDGPARANSEVPDLNSLFFPDKAVTGDLKQEVFGSQFEGANPRPSVVGEELTGYKCNYFLGNDPAKWRTDVPSYRRIVYRDLYPGIDLAFYGNEGSIEYDFIIHPGADPTAIAYRFNGVESTVVDAEGNLVSSTPWGEFAHCRPLVYQIAGDGVRTPVPGGFCISEDGRVQLDIAGGIDPAQDLVFDPLLVFGTYLGGTASDAGYGIAVPTKEFVYLVGSTTSNDFPTTNPFQLDQPAYDVFVTKLSGTGDSLIYSTYIGGNMDDLGSELAVDGDGNAYITGQTWSSNFPTINQVQDDQLTVDAFAAKLGPDGSELLYCTYLGGGSDDISRGIAVGAGGEAVVVGETQSSDYPLKNQYQSFRGMLDGFVTKISDGGGKLVYSTYLGGSEFDRAYGIAMDDVGNAYVTGNTSSSDFPILNPDGALQGGGDVFVTKLHPGGTELLYSTCVGGTLADYGYAIAVSGDGSAFVTGITLSSDFPTVGPYQTDQALVDAFVFKLDAVGRTLLYSTYLGGNATDVPAGIAVDLDGFAYVTGFTNSSDFPTAAPFQTYQGFEDAFVTKLGKNGDQLEFSSYLGGAGADLAEAIVVDQGSNAYVVGYTTSISFPTASPYQPSLSGPFDAFVVKLSTAVTDVFEPQSPMPPPASELWQNTPNPFNASTTIRFSLKTGGAAELGIYNLLGQLVRLHREPDLRPGTYSYEWDGLDDAGRNVASGVYLYRLTTQRFTQSRKMTLLK